MPNKDKLKELLSRLGNLEESLPQGETLSALDKIIKEKYSDLLTKVKDDSSIQFLNQINSKLNRFRKDFDLAPILKELDEFRDLFDQLHESVVSRFDEVSKSSASTKKELSDLVENTKDDLSKMTSGEIKNVLQKMSLLEDQLSFQDDTSKNQDRTLKEVIGDFDTRISNLVEQFKISTETAGSEKMAMDSKMGDHSKMHEGLKGEIDQLRKDLLSKIAGIGGGQANRQINVNSSLMSTKYTDINFQAAGGIGWSVSDDDTYKRVNISASIISNGAQRWIKPYHWSIAVTAQQATAGRVLLNEFEVSNPVVLDALVITNTGTVASTLGSIICGVYGPIATEETCLNASVMTESSITDSSTNNQLITVPSVVLGTGRYYIAVQYSNGNHVYLRQSNTTQVTGWCQFYDRAGGFGALTQPCPSVTNTGSAMPGAVVRAVV